MYDVKRLTVPFELKAGEGEGKLTAAIVRFDTIDSDQDVILRSAWLPGQVVPIVPAHDWQSYAIGEGITAQSGEWGVVDGELFTDTTLGMDWYRSMKRRGSRQQWSFGFEITEAERGTIDDKAVRFIQGLRLFEASPVLVGAQSASHLVSIKAQGGDVTEPDADGIKTGIPLADHTEQARAACLSVVERYQALAALRAKEGRVLSEANRRRIAGLAEQMRAALAELDDLMAATEPRTDDDGKGRLLFAAFLRDEARRLGVAV